MMISHCGNPTVGHECFLLGMELIIRRVGSNLKRLKLVVAFL